MTEAGVNRTELADAMLQRGGLLDTAFSRRMSPDTLAAAVAETARNVAGGECEDDLTIMVLTVNRA